LQAVTYRKPDRFQKYNRLEIGGSGKLPELPEFIRFLFLARNVPLPVLESLF
jgi:hypothetical protein